MQKPIEITLPKQRVYSGILRNPVALGQKCRRQYIIGQYIVDFFFRQSMLIVEIDGGYHFTEEQQRKDTIRQDWLEHMGYKVLRFTNEEVLFDTDRVIENIKTNFI